MNASKLGQIYAETKEVENGGNSWSEAGCSISSALREFIVCFSSKNGQTGRCKIRRSDIEMLV